jgi:hypothetical protein
MTSKKTSTSKPKPAKAQPKPSITAPSIEERVEELLRYGDGTGETYSRDAALAKAYSEGLKYKGR